MNNVTSGLKIVVLGSHGLIGSAVCPLLEEKYNLNIVKADLSIGIDISSDAERLNLFRKNSDAVGLVNLFGLNHHITSSKSPSCTASSILDFEPDLIQQYVHTNTILVYNTCVDFIKNCPNASSIVNIGSLYSELSPRPDMYDGDIKDIGYTISKHALIGLTKQLASHLAPRVRVNTVSPGGVKANQPDNFIAKYQELCPSSALLSASQLAGPIAFLLSEMSSSVTGHNLVCDGGWSIV